VGGASLAWGASIVAAAAWQGLCMCCHLWLLPDVCCCYHAPCSYVQVLPANDSYTSQIAAGAFRAVCEEGGALADGTDCQTDVGDSCPAGRRPVPLNGGSDGKACALCRAGVRRCAGRLHFLPAAIRLKQDATAGSRHTFLSDPRVQAHTRRMAAAA